MAKENNVVYFEDIKVSQFGDTSPYKVDFEMEGIRLLVKNSIVKQIAMGTSENESLIAIVIAYIKKESKCHIEDEVIIRGLSILVNKYSAEEMIYKIRNLKWNEISQILNANDPVEIMDEII